MLDQPYLLRNIVERPQVVTVLKRWLYLVLPQLMPRMHQY